MSHIPNSAMPHAGTIEPTPTETGTNDTEKGRSAFFRENATRAADKVREHPKTAAAAGAVLVAGAVAAAALPFLRKPEEKKTSGKTTAKKA